MQQFTVLASQLQQQEELWRARKAEIERREHDVQQNEVKVQQLAQQALEAMTRLQEDQAKVKQREAELMQSGDDAESFLVQIQTKEMIELLSNLIFCELMCLSLFQCVFFSVSVLKYVHFY